MKNLISKFLLLTVVILLVGCSDQTRNISDDGPTSGGFLAKTTSYPLADHFLVEYTCSESDLAATVASVGAVLDQVQSEIKIARVSQLADKSKFEKKNGIKWVVQDMNVQWVDPNMAVQESIGDDETFFLTYQWAPRAIHAPEAWDAGYTGQGVRVAVIDGGISSTHIDLDNNIDFAASRSFVSGKAFDEDGPGFRHATHVAGIIAAEDNGVGTIGVAPHATIIALKALDNGSGSFAAIIDAIMYAAGEADADIINMSLGALFARNSLDAAKLNQALSAATNYAYQQGVTIIVSGGNSAVDFDHAGPYVHMPSEATHVINVSATGPVDFAYGGTNFDRPASYTNYGQSFIDLAAPGGDFTSLNALWFRDMVLSPGAGTGSYYFAAGTSMAAPHVAGVAALIIGKNGGSMSPSAVAAALRQSADDLGKPGNDDFYGLGRVNALRAVSQ